MSGVEIMVVLAVWFAFRVGREYGRLEILEAKR